MVEFIETFSNIKLYKLNQSTRHVVNYVNKYLNLLKRLVTKL